MRSSRELSRIAAQRALRDGIVAVNPCTGLELPPHRGRRDRIAPPEEAARLLAALPEADRPLWATALYGGLRAGELMALRWEGIDLAAGLIRVEHAYDPKAEQFIAPKSRAGTRKVPVAAILRDYLIEAKLRSGGVGLAFAREDGRPFSGTALRDRALRAWKAAGLAPITPHECRHTFASLMIAAGVNAKSLSTWMGHANISITLDLYSHLMPGAEGEGAALMDAYLAREAGAAARRAEPIAEIVIGGER